MPPSELDLRPERLFCFVIFHVFTSSLVLFFVFHFFSTLFCVSVFGFCVSSYYAGVLPWVWFLFSFVWTGDTYGKADALESSGLSRSESFDHITEKYLIYFRSSTFDFLYSLNLHLYWVYLLHCANNLEYGVDPPQSKGVKDNLTLRMLRAVKMLG